MSDKEECGNCRFGIRERGSRLMCQRYPPVDIALSDNKVTTVFPVVHNCLWCGEFAGNEVYEQRRLDKIESDKQWKIQLNVGQSGVCSKDVLLEYFLQNWPNPLGPLTGSTISLILRLEKSLKKDGISTLHELLQYTHREVLRIPNLGRKSYNYLCAKLEFSDLCLKPNVR